MNNALKCPMIFFVILFLAATIALFILVLRFSQQKVSLRIKLQSQEKAFAVYKKETEYLKKYEALRDAEFELERVLKQSKETIDEANRTALDTVKKADVDAKKIAEDADADAQMVKKEARLVVKEMRDKAEKKLEEAHNISAKIEADARQMAKEIAGDAWEAKQNADQYSETVKAMRNIIKGYGDEYLIPNRSLLDDLADDYSHKEAGRELAQVRTQIKSMVKNREAADCDYVETHRKNTAIEFVLDAFNGKVDTIMAKVRNDNHGKLLQSLKDAYRLVNHNGKPFRNARIRERYFNVVLDQLRLASTVQELKKQDQEEQRQIREAMREEEKARRDFERALKEAEKEERLLEKAKKQAEEKLLAAAAEERDKFEKELEEIKQRLAEAEDRGQRALSMAQQTKRGHVYVISNIGSFGESIFKIGLTRRLEPMDRIKELGDASVPFAFDVHAMIHSEDAPKLEKKLHESFEKNRLNKVNYRKEFFTIQLSEIKSIVDELGLETHWTMKADAAEYKESLELKKREKAAVGYN